MELDAVEVEVGEVVDIIVGLTAVEVVVEVLEDTEVVFVELEVDGVVDV